MKKILVIAALALSVSACGVNPQQATRALSAQGIKDVKIGGYSWFAGCGKDDEFASTFTGIGQDGNPVEGVVCSGWFKGVTVRYY